MHEIVGGEETTEQWVIESTVHVDKVILRKHLVTSVATDKTYLIERDVPKETFYCIMQYYGKTEQQKAQCFCCTEQALRSTKSRLGKKLDLNRLETIRM